MPACPGPKHGSSTTSWMSRTSAIPSCRLPRMLPLAGRSVAANRTMIVAINNVEAIGLKEAQGLVAVNPFYWDFNDATRAWAKRFSERHPRKNFPNDMQAGVYAAVLHHLKIAAKLDGDVENGRGVVAAMKDMPTDDVLFGNGGDPPRWPQDAPNVRARNQASSGIEWPLGLFSDNGDHPRR